MFTLARVDSYTSVARKRWRLFCPAPPFLPGSCRAHMCSLLEHAIRGERSAPQPRVFLPRPTISDRASKPRTYVFTPTQVGSYTSVARKRWRLFCPAPPFFAGQLSSTYVFVARTRYSRRAQRTVTACFFAGQSLHTYVFATQAHTDVRYNPQDFCPCSAVFRQSDQVAHICVHFHASYHHSVTDTRGIGPLSQTRGPSVLCHQHAERQSFVTNTQSVSPLSQTHEPPSPRPYA